MDKKFTQRMGMKLILPDTNVVILGLAGERPIATHFRRWIETKALLFSCIVVAEFLVGATKEEAARFNALIRHFEVAPADLLTAQIAAGYRKKYLQRRKKLLLPDCLIAATAKIRQATLATFDKRDYPMGDIKFYTDFKSLQ